MSRPRDSLSKTTRCVTSSSGSSAGAQLPACCGWLARHCRNRRLVLWIPAVVLDLCAPYAGYWLPRRGHLVTTDYDIDGGHFTDRCQGFVIIALGESIVVTGATAADAGLTPKVVLCLGVAFLETAALWWLYFSAVAERSRLVMEPVTIPADWRATPTPTSTLRSSPGSSPWQSATTGRSRSRDARCPLSASPWCLRTVVGLLSAAALWELRTRGHAKHAGSRATGWPADRGID